jgi:hypothetical protein
MKELLLLQPWEYGIILFITISVAFFSKVHFVLNKTFKNVSSSADVPDNKYQVTIYPDSWKLLRMITKVIFVIIFIYLIVKIGFLNSFVAFCIIFPTSIILALIFPVTKKSILKSCLNTIDRKLDQGPYYSSEEIKALSNYRQIVRTEIGLPYDPNPTIIHNMCFKSDSLIDYVAFNSEIIVVQKGNNHFTGSFDKISEFEKVIVGSGKIAMEKHRDKDGLVKPKHEFDFKITVSFNMPDQEHAKVAISSKILNISTDYIPRVHDEEMDNLVNETLNKVS